MPLLCRAYARAQNRYTSLGCPFRGFPATQRGLAPPTQGQANRQMAGKRTRSSGLADDARQLGVATKKAALLWTTLQETWRSTRPSARPAHDSGEPQRAWAGQTFLLRYDVFPTSRGHRGYAQRLFLILMQPYSRCTAEPMTAANRSERGLQRRASTVLLISLATQSDLLLPERGSSLCATYPMGTCSRTQCACQIRTSIRCLPDHTRPLRLRAAVVSDTDAAVLAVHS